MWFTGGTRDCSGLTSGDEDDLASKTGNVGIWVETGGRHCCGWQGECDVEERESECRYVVAIAVLFGWDLCAAGIVQSNLVTPVKL